MDYMLMPLHRYADFQGRSQRKEYWMFFLFVIIGYVVAALLDSMLGMSGLIGGIYGPLLTLFGLAMIIPGLAVQVRRFHDQDKSGWLVLLALIPIIGGIAVVVFMCLDGTHGPNRFGPDPKGQAPAETFS